MRRRGNISLKLFAQMLVKAGFSHIITVDMHSKESQGFFDCAIDNLRASPFLIQYIQEHVSSNCSKNEQSIYKFDLAYVLSVQSSPKPAGLNSPNLL
jgi:phosphoribosylpyrophosphate synthetase